MISISFLNRNQWFTPDYNFFLNFGFYQKDYYHEEH